MRIIGLDPGLRHAGWGVIDYQGNRLSYVAAGTINPAPKAPMAERLKELHEKLSEIIDDYRPEQAAIEETFVNKNPASALKLGMARGVILMTPARFHIPCAEYAPNVIKKSVVGTGHAAKEQIQMMVKTLLPKADISAPDQADALAVAICHAHYL